MLLPIDPWDPDCDVYVETTSIVSIRREERSSHQFSWKAIGYLSGPRTEREDDKNESASHCAYFTMREGGKFVVALTEKETFRDLTAYLSGTALPKPVPVLEFVRCINCSGRGLIEESGEPKVYCEVCKGSGEKPSGGATTNTVRVEPLQGFLDRTVNELVIASRTKRVCPSCKGKGFLQDVMCHECRGTGKVP